MKEPSRKTVFVLGVILVTSLLFVGSFVSHEPYTETKVSIEGPPVETNAPEQVFTQDEMSSEQYGIAVSLLSTSFTVKEYKNEKFIYQDSNSVTINREQYNKTSVEPFLTHQFVEVDGSQYEVVKDVERFNKYDYFTVFDLLLLLVTVVVSSMLLVEEI